MVEKELSDFMPKANSDGELVFGKFLSDKYDINFFFINFNS